MTTTITPALGVVPRLVELAEEFGRRAHVAAERLDVMPSMAQLTDVEEDLLAKLAEVREQKTARVVAEHERRSAVEAADAMRVLAGRLRVEATPPGPDEVLAATGLMPRSADPYGPPLIPEQVHPATPETVEAARRTGALPIVPDDVVSGDATPTADVAPGRVVATSGPTQTQPDPGAAHPVPNPPTPPTPSGSSAWPEPTANPSPAAEPSKPAQPGARHKKGGRK